MILETPQEPKRSFRKADESVLQAKCFQWLWNTYPQTRKLFFAVLNENEQSKYETTAQQRISGARRKARGVISGVADSLMLLPRGPYHGLCAEAKTPIGHQSEAQKEWQKIVEKAGYYYFVYHTFEEFKEEMEKYLSL